MATINTTYQPGGMTTRTEGIGGGGPRRGFGGGGGFGGFDEELLQIYRNRAAEAAADRARQRQMERQRFEWERMAQLRANPAGGNSAPNGLQGDLQSSAMRRQLMENQAAMRAPQRELINSAPGLIGGYGGPNIQNMNAIERGLYAPANAIHEPEKDEQAQLIRRVRLGGGGGVGGGGGIGGGGGY